MSFIALGVSPELSASLEKKNIVKPTDIQNQSIPLLLQDSNDMIGLAQTGTGKTFAFGIPVLELTIGDMKNTQSIIVAPTRELARQISQDLMELAKSKEYIHIETVYGGTSVSAQIKDIRKKVPHIVVGTPGRIIDLLKRNVIRIDEVQRVILDEADEMLNMGFKEDIYEILSYTPDDKRIWLYSATMPKEIKKIAKTFMVNPMEIKINEKEMVNRNIEHMYAVIKRENKTKAVARFIEANPDMYGIVFCRTRIDTQRLADELQARGYKSESLHGDLSQQQRDRVIRKFKSKAISLLIATDVAARGLDVDDLTHVLHHSLPDDKEYYTHRSGRTARAGKKGLSIALIQQGDVRKINQLEKMLKIRFEVTKIPSLEEVREGRLLAWMKEVFETEINSDISRGLFQDAEATLMALPKDELIRRMMSRELSSYINESNEDLNVKHSIKEKMALKNFKGDKFFINLGKKDKLEKNDLIKIISKESGLDPKFIGLVTMDRLHSFFEVDKKHSKNVANHFKNKFHKGRALRVNRHQRKK